MPNEFNAAKTFVTYTQQKAATVWPTNHSSGLCFRKRDDARKHEDEGSLSQLSVLRADELSAVMRFGFQAKTFTI